MKFGAMNNPRNSLIEEVELFSGYGLDYVELTIEAPQATPEIVRGLKDELSAYDLPFIGHMPWFLQITSPYPKVREAFINEAEKVIDAAAELQMPYVTIHPDFLKLHRKSRYILDATADSLGKLSAKSQDKGVRLCFENFEKEHFSADDMRKLFKRVPALGFTLDVGHAFMGQGNVDHIRHLIKKFRDRLVNVHIHDNFGANDDHLPLGAGKLDYGAVVSELKKAGYEGGMTLEIHSQDREYIKVSRDKLLKLL